MNIDRNLIKNFGKTFRLLTKLEINTKDVFFAGMIAKENERFLSEYFGFLKAENRAVTICGHLILKIKNFNKLGEILRHLELIETIEYFNLKKELLSLELGLVNFMIANRKEQKTSKEKNAVTIKEVSSEKINNLIGDTHKEIIDFINGKEKVQNLEIFDKFSFVTRRTLKRKLSELVSSRILNRIPLGKKVFYSKN